MSDIQPPPARRGSGCLAALMIGAGVVLLLPGVCAYFFIQGGRADTLATLSMTIPMVGLALIAFGAYYEYGRNRARDEVEAPTSPRAGARTAAMVVGVILAVGSVLAIIVLGLLRGLLR